MQNAPFHAPKRGVSHGKRACLALPPDPRRGGRQCFVNKNDNDMKRTTATLLLAAALTAAARQQPDAWGDLGDGTYANPVLNADYSDPDVIRVGDKYYMVASDFHYIGLQVLESADMVNWTVVSQVYDRLDFPGWDSNRRYAGGSWAPSIRWHDGRFWVFFCTPHEGLFMSTATDARGPWAPLHCVKRVEKWEDPCPLWDDDGQAYLGHSVHGAGPIIVHRMATDGTRLLDEGRTVYTGPVAEGTKWLKRGGYYYLSIPEGGVERGWQTVLRSRSVYGPYERRVVLEQGSTPVNGPHQGALVDTPGGQWWFYHFQSAGPRGRVVHLQPAKWADGWPQIGADLDGNGIGEPVARHAKPATGAAAKPSLPQTSDSFDGTKLYWRGSSRSALMPQWQWCHNPADGAWSLSERPGWLTLRALRADSLRPCRGMLTQKAMGYGGTATTTVELADSAGGCFAGLLCMGRQFRAVGLCAEGIAVECDGRRTVVARGNFSKARLRVVSDMKANTHRFYYSTDGSDFIPAGGPFAMREGYWKGVRLGLFCYNTLGNGGSAAFDCFDYEVDGRPAE